MLVYFLMIKLQGESSQMAGPAQGRPDSPNIWGSAWEAREGSFIGDLGISGKSV